MTMSVGSANRPVDGEIRRGGVRAGRSLTAPFLSEPSMNHYESPSGDVAASALLNSPSRSRAPADQKAVFILDRIQRASVAGPDAVHAISGELLAWAADENILRHAWDHLATQGGQAPGPNGRRYSDLDDGDVWELLRSIGFSMRHGACGRGPLQTVRVPKDPLKPDGDRRALRLSNIENRVAQRAILDIVNPLLDPLLGDLVAGNRKGKGRQYAIAHAERLLRSGAGCIWLTEDLKNAFDRVPLDQLRQTLLVYLPNAELVELIVALVGTGTKNGIQQGGPLSPLLLNVYLHHVLDRKWAKLFPTIPMIRFVDDLLLLCRTRAEAHRTWKELYEILEPAGMLLKGMQDGAPDSDVIADVRESKIHWLGFRLRFRREQLDVDLEQSAWKRLAHRFEECHTSPNAPLRAEAMAVGWLTQMAPCYGTVKRSNVATRLREVADESGFDEISSTATLKAHWKNAYERWSARKTEILCGEPARKSERASRCQSRNG